MLTIDNIAEYSFTKILIKYFANNIGLDRIRE